VQPDVFEFVIGPIRSVLGVTEQEIVESVHEARDIEANLGRSIAGLRRPSH
jgi:hypothetical protein